MIHKILHHNFFERSGTFLKNSLGILYLLAESLLKLGLVLKVHFAYPSNVKAKGVRGKPKWFALSLKDPKIFKKQVNSLACKQLQIIISFSTAQLQQVKFIKLLNSQYLSFSRFILFIEKVAYTLT